MTSAVRADDIGDELWQCSIADSFQSHRCLLLLNTISADCNVEMGVGIIADDESEVSAFDGSLSGGSSILNEPHGPLRHLSTYLDRYEPPSADELTAD